MSDDYLHTIRFGGGPTRYKMLLPAAASLALLGLPVGALLVFGLKEIGLGVLTWITMLAPVAVVTPLALRAFRRHRLREDLLRRGERAWGRVVSVERGMARYKRRPGFRRRPHEGIFHAALVTVDWMPAGGSTRRGLCQGWYHPSELDALERGAQAPVIGLDGVPEVVVAQIPRAT